MFLSSLKTFTIYSRTYIILIMYSLTYIIRQHPPRPSSPEYMYVCIWNICISIMLEITGSFDKMFSYTMAEMHRTPRMADLYVISHIWMSHRCCAYEWVMAHIWMSHGTHTHMKHTLEANIWMSHVTHMYESCHTYEWVTDVAHMLISFHNTLTHMCDVRFLELQISMSCHTYEWVMSHIWMSHVTHMNESCHTYEWVMSHIW